MTGDEFAARLEREEVSLVDVRSAEEYEGTAGYPCDPSQGHIPGAVNVDISDLAATADPKALLEDRGVDLTRPLVTYCHSGQRSEHAALLLRSAGLEVENYEGSWHEWSRRP